MEEKRRTTDENGMTLVEMMVASVVSLILLTGIFQFFLIQTRNFNENRMIAEMQQELRYASNYIADKMKLAGNGIPSLSLPGALKVIDNIDGGPGGNDYVTVIGSFKSLVLSTTQKMGNEGSQIKVSSSQGIEDYDLVVISLPDSGWQEVFMCTKIASDLHIWHDAYPPWNPDNKLDHRYLSGSVVTIVSHYGFFVQEDESGRPNLMVQTQGPYPPQILAGDIDNFQVRFKLKNDTWVNSPVDVTDIRLMEITLRAMTPDPLPDYVDPVYGDGHKRIELKTVVIPKNITKVSF